MPVSDVQIIAELAYLRDENARLRQQLNLDDYARNQAKARRLVERAQRNAEVLLSAHFGYLPIVRRESPLGRRSHEAAVALLKLARLHNGKRITVTDPALAMKRLARATQTALHDPTMLSVLLPRSRRPKGLRTQGGTGHD